MSVLLEIALLALFVIGLLLIVTYLYQYFSYSRYIRRLIDGQYERFLEINGKRLERAEKKPRLRNVLLYNTANCYHRKGDLELCLQTLEQLERQLLDNLLGGAYYALYAQTLMLLRRDIPTAEASLERSHQLRPTPCRPLYQAYLELLKGDHEAARHQLAEFEASRSEKPGRRVGFYTVLVHDQLFSDLEVNFYLGACHLRLRDHQRARIHLENACDAPYPNIYTSRARKLLSGLGAMMVE